MAIAIHKKYTALNSSPALVDHALLRIISVLGFKQWLVIFAAFIVLRTDQYFLAFFFTIKDVALFVVAANCVNALSGIAGMTGAIIHPFISKAWVRNDHQTIRSLVLSQQRCALILMLTASSILLIVAEEAFDLWLGAGKFIGEPILVLLLVMAIMELHHNGMVSLLYAVNEVGLYWQAILSAVLNVGFTIIFLKAFGIIGVPLGTFMAQACTSYWYGTYRALPVLQLSWGVYLERVVIPLLLFLGFSMLINQLIWHLVPSPRWALVGMVVCGALIAASVIYLWGLDARARAYLRRKSRSI